MYVAKCHFFVVFKNIVHTLFCIYHNSFNGDVAYRWVMYNIRRYYLYAKYNYANCYVR